MTPHDYWRAVANAWRLFHDREWMANMPPEYCASLGRQAVALKVSMLCTGTAIARLERRGR